MTTQTTVTRATFTRPFRLPGMDRPFPPGVYEIETDQETLDVMSSTVRRRTATRIRLSSPGLEQVLTIDQKDLAAALVADARSA